MSLGNPFPPLCFKPKFDFYSSFWARCWVWGEVGRKRSKYLYSMSCVSEFRIAFFFSLQKANLLVRKVQYLHTKFSFSMSIFLRDSKIFSVTCGCVQKLNIYKIYLENLRFSSPVIEFFYPCSRVAANFFSL